MAANDSNERHRLILVTRTPLGFFTLVVLVTETVLAGLAIASTGSDRTFLLYAIVGILVLLILVVGVIAVLRPESLQGATPETQQSRRKRSVDQ
jgi:hypothetical protein